MPGGSPVSRYSPPAFVIAVPGPSGFAGDSAVTVAPGRMARDSSRTRPMTFPVSTCASTGSEHNIGTSIATIVRSLILDLLLIRIGNPNSRYATPQTNGLRGNGDFFHVPLDESRGSSFGRGVPAGTIGRRQVTHLVLDDPPVYALGDVPKSHDPSGILFA